MVFPPFAGARRVGTGRRQGGEVQILVIFEIEAVFDSLRASERLDFFRPCRAQQLQIWRTGPNWSPSEEQNHCEILGAVGTQDQNSLDVAGSTRSRDERDKTRVVFTVPYRE
jgi:hypothetical protein